MSFNHGSKGVIPITIQPPQPASLCSVEIQKYVRAHDGIDKTLGRGTGFHFRDISGQVWLVTNWHVLTARRPDDPTKLVGNATTSPSGIRVAYQSKRDGQFLPHLSMNLYDAEGAPIWHEFKREESGIDLAVIAIDLPDDVKCPCVQDFAVRGTDPFVPGLDLIIVGMAFPHGQDNPYPIWKSARVASEPGYLVMGVPQVLIDAAGVPGMSGSPIYRVRRGVSAPIRGDLSATNANAEVSPIDRILMMDPTKMVETNILEFIGVYAGSTGCRDLDRLSLGRMFTAPLLDLLVREKQPGRNPFPPDLDTSR